MAEIATDTEDEQGEKTCGHCLPVKFDSASGTDSAFGRIRRAIKNLSKAHCGSQGEEGELIVEHHQVVGVLLRSAAQEEDDCRSYRLHLTDCNSFSPATTDHTSALLRRGYTSVMPTLGQGLRSVGSLRLRAVFASDRSAARRSVDATCEGKSRSGLWSLRGGLRE